MIAYIISFVKFLFGFKDENEAEEEFLSNELFILEKESSVYLSDNGTGTGTTLVDGTDVAEENCFQKNGVITYLDLNYVMIDGTYHFETTHSTQIYNVNDSVNYIGYKDKHGKVKIIRIKENYGTAWGEVDDDVKHFKIIDHVIIGQVDSREERFVFIKDTELKFSLDDIQTTFIPVKGDWLEILCRVQWDDDKPSVITAEHVIKVLSIRPLRRVKRCATITHLTLQSGICDNEIYFDKNYFTEEFVPQIGSKVLVEAIESNQGICTWRAIHVLSTGGPNVVHTINKVQNEDEPSLKIEKEKNIEMTYPTLFNNISYQQSSTMCINVANRSSVEYKIVNWKILNKKSNSQLTVKPIITNHINLCPNGNVNFLITCKPKFLGLSKESFVLIFDGFELKRSIEVNVIDGIPQKVTTNKARDNEKAMLDMKNILNNKALKPYILPGVKPTKSPNFIAVKLQQFPIPNKLWSIILENSACLDNILATIDKQYPYLTANLNIVNYTEKWHTLLYMEEIQQNLAMRSYDRENTFLTKYQDYLSLEIESLSEKRPSLIIGDRAIVKDTWDPKKRQYEGFIHATKGNLVLMKFNQYFHNKYSGYDISIEFHFNRNVYRKFHQAVNMAVSNLTHDILFPTRISCRPPQISEKNLKSIKWFNENLNDLQKTAIHNVLLGVCRPMPYCIYGPPGTGKTMTVVETILQILTLIPDSRILVATPSNSAANLVTERLAQYKTISAGSMIRLIAFHLLTSDRIPDNIKPFCATIDIAIEKTVKSSHRVTNEGINLSCSSSFVCRHRVTIATCVCLGSLVQLGLPPGHFTHLVIDEAGHASEPEILIPMSFMNNVTSQIILAGDPMQLGPTILSKYSKEYGMETSYLSRILETFPYQKDIVAFKETKYDKRFVTKLLNNYRSLENVLSVPNELFYDNSLISNINANRSWITKLLNDISEIFPNNKNGGIYMYGIRGHNLRGTDSPSWYNPQEALMILMSTCKLYKRKVTPDEIGIITPYVAQVRYLRQLFDSMGALQPKIGTVEEFQGQERPIIIISTVRSCETYIQDDVKHALGFIQNPKRLNVALTRAQVAVIIFCNPHLLCLDSLWNKIITHVVNNDCYIGCDLPQSLSYLEVEH